jgi:S1-C subfamily serine protease
MTLWYLSRQAVGALLGLAVTLAFLLACTPTLPDTAAPADAAALAPQALAPQDDAARLQAATLTLLPGRCQGVVAEEAQSALTAAHCIEAGERTLRVRLHDGRVLSARVVRVDRPQDVAFLRLEQPSGVVPLHVADALPFPGAALRFISSRHHAGEVQQVELLKLGRCPSLPAVPAALFTSLRGRPGDSGAPVVDAQLQVVGLVHGGARCAIATPTVGLGGELAVLGRAAPSRLARRAPVRR